LPGRQFAARDRHDVRLDPHCGVTRSCFGSQAKASERPVS
jgi:hypothetical protein